MSILYEMIELAACFIEMYILYKIYDVILHKCRYMQNRRIDIYLASAGGLMIRMCNHISAFSYFTMLVALLYMSISAVFLYKTDLVMTFSIASFYLLCLSSFDMFVLTLIASFGRRGATVPELVSTMGIPRVMMILVIKVSWVLTYAKLKKYLYKFSVKMSQAYAILTISCIGFLGFVFFARQTFEAFHYTLTGIWLLFVVFMAFLLFASYFIIITREGKLMMDFLGERNHLLEENYSTIKDIYTGNAKLYHDLNNHLNVVYQLMDSGNTEEAQAYIRKISEPMRQLSNTIWTGEEVVDVIINSKLAKMKEKGISSEINVEFPQNTNLSSHDICTILANLLDNAIEAAEPLGASGNISLTIRRIHHFLTIKVSNSCVGKHENFSCYPKTTKHDKMFHGWGLPSVMDAVEKYNGTFKCINKEHQFIVSIMLFFESSIPQGE